MSIISFTCCDICNPNAQITADRRQQQRDEASGRRNDDICNWIEGAPDDCTDCGWIITSKGKHVCPRCYQHHKEAVFSI